MVRVSDTILISETPSVTDLEASLPPSKKKPRKILYTLIGIVAVAAVALALVFLTYQGMDAAIPLVYNFAPADHMTYNMTITGSNTRAAGQNSSQTGTVAMDVLSFDGENYTINVTATFSLQEGAPYSLTFTEKMNKTGYITNISFYTLNGTQQTYPSTSGIPGLGTFFEKDQAKVGETWQVPMSSWSNGNSSSGWMGNLTFTFGDIQYVTVPAGTYKVFRFDITGSNLTLSLNQPLSDSENMSITAQEYIEYGTCRTIDSNMQENLSFQVSGQNFTMNLYLQMKLVQDDKD
jgi:hypothetical protein